MISDFIPDYVKYVVTGLNSCGYEAYLVGGCVRDILMGRLPSDYDIATNALPKETACVFESEKIITSGMRHGTVGVVAEGNVVEITTYRIDGAYSDLRHPEKVTFTEKIEEDLSRRDFTVNAMAMSPDGKIKDPFGGMNDIERKIIRTVGCPNERFSEDALRIMRALRFSSVLGFLIENETYEAAVNKKALLKMIAPERIYSELKKLLAGENASVALMGGRILPECGELEKRTEEERKDSALALALLFSDCDRAKRALSYLKADKKTEKSVTDTLNLPFPLSERDMRFLLGKHSAECVTRLISFAYLKGKISSREKYMKILSEAEKKCNSIKALAVDGNDVKAMGYSGKEIKEALERLLSDVISGVCENNREELLARL